MRTRRNHLVDALNTQRVHDAQVLLDGMDVVEVEFAPGIHRPALPACTRMVARRHHAGTVRRGDEGPQMRTIVVERADRQIEAAPQCGDQAKALPEAGLLGLDPEPVDVRIADQHR
jgi:hypothetical protein